MKTKSREVIVGITLVIFSLTIGIFISTNIYSNKTLKTTNKVTQKEIAYKIETPVKEYVPNTLALFNASKKEEVKPVVEEPKKEETPKEEVKKEEPVKEEIKQEEIKKEEKVIVYDGLTLEELTAKLNRNLGSNLSGMGHIYASYSLELGIDPYLALAISLHETGCKWNCSKLVRECNNVGGQKGGPSCNGGSYKKFDTIEEGIKGYLDNLKKNYYDCGLTTPEAMNKKYAASTTWAVKVNSYIDSIKAN